MRKVLTGHGLVLTLDSDEIFPDDPGQGTPAMVRYGGGDATYYCAIGEGVVTDGRCVDIPLNDTQLRWLEAQEDLVNSFIEENA
jgi:hypothetical protein